MGAQPLPGQKDFRLPFSFTAGVKDGGTTLQVAAPPDGDARGVALFDTARAGAGAVVLRQRRGQRPGRLRRLRSGGPGVAELRLRQLRHARREGQGRRRAALLPRGRRPEDADDPVALRRSALQGDAGAAARRQGAARRDRPALAQRRRDDSDELRHGARRVGHRRRQRLGRRRPGALRRRARTAPSRTSRSASTRATRTPPASRCPA